MPPSSVTASSVHGMTGRTTEAVMATGTTPAARAASLSETDRVTTRSGVSSSVTSPNRSVTLTVRFSPGGSVEPPGSDEPEQATVRAKGTASSGTARRSDFKTHLPQRKD
ncbi:hypothetical protein NJ76_06735 [Rhodococcus sp. IITR03]|nr:hypothetical protein NJ76_06735 [Rhodococcus sp. IITR03]